MEPLRLELCFHSSTETREHQFFQSILPDETGFPRVARNVDTSLVLEALSALSAAPASKHLFRAIAQYDLALRYWIPGHETLSLAHLFMAMEVLTTPARDAAIAQNGLTARSELAKLWKVQPNACAGCGHSYGLNGLVDAEVRRRILFRGNNDIYRIAKDASDGLEHGYREFDAIYGDAVATRDEVAALVRSAILGLTDLAPETTTRMTVGDLSYPLGSADNGLYLNCVVTADDPANMSKEGNVYPYFECASSIKSVKHEADGTWTVEPDVTGAAAFGNGAIARNISFAIWGPTTPENDTA